MWETSNRPDGLSDGLVLGDDARVIERHLPSRERDHVAPVAGVEGRRAGSGAGATAAGAWGDHVTTSGETLVRRIARRISQRDPSAGAHRSSPQRVAVRMAKPQVDVGSARRSARPHRRPPVGRRWSMQVWRQNGTEDAGRVARPGGVHELLPQRKTSSRIDSRTVKRAVADHRVLGDTVCLGQLELLGRGKADEAVQVAFAPLVDAEELERPPRGAPAGRRRS